MALAPVLSDILDKRLALEDTNTHVVITARDDRRYALLRRTADGRYLSSSASDGEPYMAPSSTSGSVTTKSLGTTSRGDGGSGERGTGKGSFWVKDRGGEPKRAEEESSAASSAKCACTIACAPSFLEQRRL